MACRSALILTFSLLLGCDFSSTATTPIAAPPPLELDRAAPPTVSPQATREPRERLQSLERQVIRAESALSVLRTEPAKRRGEQQEFLDNWLAQIDYDISSEVHTACDGSEGRAQNYGESKRDLVASRLRTAMAQASTPSAVLTQQAAQLKVLLDTYPNGDADAAAATLASAEMRLDVRGW